VLVDEGRVSLLASQIVLDEFERNRSRVEADITRGLRPGSGIGLQDTDGRDN
jgi:hypothetical protein